MTRHEPRSSKLCKNPPTSGRPTRGGRNGLQGTQPELHRNHPAGLRTANGDMHGRTQ